MPSSRRFLIALTGGVILLGLAAPAEAAFPGQNGRIAFESGRDGNPEIFAMKRDGSAQTNLTNNPDPDFLPSYSPDGRRIAFSRYSVADDNVDLYVMDADGSDQRRITFNEQVDVDPAWSPDGKRLVFVREPLPESEEGPAPPPDLWIVDLKDGEERNLTNSPATPDFEPQWSPDGARIAFNSDASEPDNIDVYTIRPNGRGLRRLTSAPGFDGGPNYSPDGRLIAFDSERTGNPDVFVMRANGARPTQLTDDPGVDILSAYSPDGRSIAFTSDRDGDQIPDAPPGELFPDIFRMRADGSQETNLTNSPTIFEANPDWQPDDDHHHHDDHDNDEEEGDD
jgi:Tol biopolymer transport system component